MGTIVLLEQPGQLLYCEAKVAKIKELWEAKSSVSVVSFEDIEIGTLGQPMLIQGSEG